MIYQAIIFSLLKTDYIFSHCEVSWWQSLFMFFIAALKNAIVINYGLAPAIKVFFIWLE